MRLVNDLDSTRRRSDPVEIQRALALMVDSEVFEIRIPKAGRYRTIRGYFNDLSAAVKSAEAWSGQAPAVYITLNPVNPALLARANNRMETFAESTTSDTDILSRRWFLIDVDPKRPAGISSSHSEHAAALEKARQVRAWLTEQGWPAPIEADSGNGGHLLYRIALSNEPDNTLLLQRALQALAARFDSAAVSVDTGVFNASRISKLYGTLACKGDDTPDRPHRMARILEAPAALDYVSLELLEELAGPVQKPESRSPSPVHWSSDFFSSVNQNAMERLGQWVPRLLPDAKPYRNGYRVTSRNLHRDCEEDLGIHPDGIKDFGVHDAGDPKGGRRTPIDLVMEWGVARDAKEAALWLCDQMGLSPDQLGWNTRVENPSRPTPFDRDCPPLDAYIDDFNIRYGDKTQEIKPPENEFIALADFIVHPPKSTYLIKGILPGRGLGQVFGASNVGKSFLLIDMAMHVALGKPWRGHKTRQACVLYIAAEGLSGLAGRFKAWADYYQQVPTWLFIRPYSAQLTVQGAALALAERIKSLPQPPKLIILDTLAANFGPGDENSAADMALAMSALRMLAGDWLAVCVHHSGHGDKTRGRGHSSLYATLDMEIQVSRDDATSEIKVAHTKCRDMDRMEPLFFRLKPQALPWADEDGDPINSAVIVPADAPANPDVEQGPSLSRKQSEAREVLRRMYEERQANVGPTGTPRVSVSEWGTAMIPMDKDSGHRTRTRNELLQKKMIRIENGYVYLL
jgi:hypothetical protein